MNSRLPIIVNYTVSAGLCLLLGGGCGKSTSEAPAPLPLEQIAPTVQSSLAGADQDARNQVAQYLADLQNKDLAAAFVDLHELRSRPGLTPGQKAVLARALMTTSQKLQEAAANGDDRAAQVLHDYLSAHRHVERPASTAAAQLPGSSPSTNQ